MESPAGRSLSRKAAGCCPYFLLVRLQHQHGRVQEVGDCPGVMLEEEVHFDLQRGDVENGELFKVIGIPRSLVPREPRRKAERRRAGVPRRCQRGWGGGRAPLPQARLASPHDQSAWNEKRAPRPKEALYILLSIWQEKPAVVL